MSKGQRIRSGARRNWSTRNSPSAKAKLPKLTPRALKNRSKYA